MGTRSVYPASRLSGTVDLPGDKSISHRSALLAALCDGDVKIENYSPSADCRSTLQCLAAMGIGHQTAGRVTTVAGKGKFGLTAPAGLLDCGNSGTTMRLISGILAGQAFQSTLGGDASLNARPMRRVIDPLTRMGAAIASHDDHAPLTITGSRPLKRISYEPPVASAQIKSAVLLAGLFADGTTSVVERVGTRDHTERMLRWLAIDVQASSGPDGEIISVDGSSALRARDLIVPGDISAAAFFMVAAACLPGSDIEFKGVGFNPSRSGIVGVLTDLGVDVVVSNEREVCNEPVADLRVARGVSNVGPRPVLSGSMIANIIDEIPIIAVLGTQLANGIEIRGARELRVKETDRIDAVARNLRAMGAALTEFDDGFMIERSQLNGAEVGSFGDHRIAMAFAVAGLFADGTTSIADAECVSVSFPDFFDELSSVSVSDK